MRVLFLDDEESRFRALLGTPSAKIITWAQTANEAIRFLSKGCFDLVMLDHDLSEEHYVALLEGREPSGPATGFDVAKWMAENAERFATATIVIHSLNAPAAERMARCLIDAGLYARRIPFGWLKV